MGVLNVTPDSFSDGGEYLEVEKALARASELVSQGAEIIDVGGESTRPSTFRSGTPLGIDEEIGRVIPVIDAVSAQYPDLPISIDTYKGPTANAALKCGAVMVNDISALRADPDMVHIIRRSDAFACLMHMPGLPTAMPQSPTYENVVAEVHRHLAEQAAYAEKCGVGRRQICIDPGIGFGKSVEQNLQLINQLQTLTRAPWPVLVGPSRKSFLGAVLGGVEPSQRLEATLAAVTLCVSKGAAIVRVHDPAAARRAALVAAAICTERYNSSGLPIGL